MIVYLDCSTGVSGDMLLASLAHLLEEYKGESCGFAFLEQALTKVGLAGFTLQWSQKKISSIMTHCVNVVKTTSHPLRALADLESMIMQSNLPKVVQGKSLEAVRLLAAAEAKVHGTSIGSVHFHEIGAVDTIVDICGTALLLHELGVEKVIYSPVDLGSDFVKTAHGLLPVPPPACAEIARGLTTFGSESGMERATPTGLTLLRIFADECGPLPLGIIQGVGYGSGGRSSDEQPTYVRAFGVIPSKQKMSEHAHECIGGCYE